MKKRRHHYVWQYYLKAWATGGRVACLRRGKVFSSGTSTLAVETDFYRIRELTAMDLVVINGLLGKAAPMLQSLHQGWVKTFTGLSALRRELEGAGSVSDDARCALDEAENNLEEDLHAKIESGAIPYLDALRRDETDFLASGDDWPKFAHYLAVQYMRTKKIRSASIAAVSAVSATPIPGFDAERAWGVLSHIFATNISHALVSRRADHQITILEAHHGAEFVTSDQPAINLLALGKAPHEEVKDLELYYPVSPSRALLIEVDKGSGARVGRRSISDAETWHYNETAHLLAHEQTFATDEDVLRRLSAAAEDPGPSTSRR